MGEDGFEPSKRYAADLQSVPFGHSGTPPYEIDIPHTELFYYSMECGFVKGIFDGYGIKLTAMKTEKQDDLL